MLCFITYRKAGLSYSLYVKAVKTFWHLHDENVGGGGMTMIMKMVMTMMMTMVMRSSPGHLIHLLLLLYPVAMEGTSAALADSRHG